MELADLTEEQKISYGIAIREIADGRMHTLWVNRLKEEYPEMYEYAVNKKEAEDM